MSNASDIAAARIIRTNSEGYRSDVYDDATAEKIQCQGQPTVGYGCRCRQWSEPFSRKVLSLELGERETPLLQFPWYIGANDARRSALLEIDFNQGETGLVKGYPRLVAAVEASDWAEAAGQCTVRQAHLQARYARLAEILSTGADQ